MLTQAQSELWIPDEESSRYPADEPNVCSNGVLVITDPLTGYGFWAMMYSHFPLFGRKQPENGVVLRMTISAEEYLFNERWLPERSFAD